MRHPLKRFCCFSEYIIQQFENYISIIDNHINDIEYLKKLDKIIELIDNEKINFKFNPIYVGKDEYEFDYKNNLGDVFKAIPIYKVEKIFEERIDLTKALFKFLEKRVPQINNPETVPLSMDSYKIYEHLHKTL